NNIEYALLYPVRGGAGLLPLQLLEPTAPGRACNHSHMVSPLHCLPLRAAITLPMRNRARPVHTKANKITWVAVNASSIQNTPISSCSVGLTSISTPASV